jgi:hypothetical protein
MSAVHIGSESALRASFETSWLQAFLDRLSIWMMAFHSRLDHASNKDRRSGSLGGFRHLWLVTVQLLERTADMAGTGLRGMAHACDTGRTKRRFLSLDEPGGSRRFCVGCVDGTSSSTRVRATFLLRTARYIHRLVIIPIPRPNTLSC